MCYADPHARGHRWQAGEMPQVHCHRADSGQPCYQRTRATAQVSRRCRTRRDWADRVFLQPVRSVGAHTLFGRGEEREVPALPGRVADSAEEPEPKNNAAGNFNTNNTAPEAGQQTATKAVISAPCR